MSTRRAARRLFQRAYKLGSSSAERPSTATRSGASSNSNASRMSSSVPTKTSLECFLTTGVTCVTFLWSFCALADRESSQMREHADKGCVSGSPVSPDFPCDIFVHHISLTVREPLLDVVKCYSMSIFQALVQPNLRCRLARRAWADAAGWDIE